MSLYPSLEDMKVDHMARAQVAYGSDTMRTTASARHQPTPSAPYGFDITDDTPSYAMYPTLNEYMGLEFTDEIIANNMPEYLPRQSGAHSSVVPSSGGAGTLVAPLSGDSVGLQRAQVTHGVRQVVVCKGEDDKVGLRVKDIDKGVFVSFVRKKSPAALAGLRFGDQILQINGKNVAGMSMETVHHMFKKCDGSSIELAVRDRPFERTVTLYKDSTDHIGFQFRDGEITAIVKDSSAARNGLLINHHLLEVDGQNVVGMKDKQITETITDGGQIVTITIMPSFVFKHMIKNMGSSLLTKLMDHSIYDF